MKYTVTVQLDKEHYEFLRIRYGKRATVKAETLVALALAEVVRDAALKYINEHGYAQVPTPPGEGGEG
jgi:hypothetical protein